MSFNFCSWWQKAPRSKTLYSKHAWLKLSSRACNWLQQLFIAFLSQLARCVLHLFIHTGKYSAL